MTNEELALELEPLITAVDNNTEKQQEILERLECMDNTLDDISSLITNTLNEQEDKPTTEGSEVIDLLRRISQQLG